MLKFHVHAYADSSLTSWFSQAVQAGVTSSEQLLRMLASPQGSDAGYQRGYVTRLGDTAERIHANLDLLERVVSGIRALQVEDVVDAIHRSGVPTDECLLMHHPEHPLGAVLQALFGVDGDPFADLVFGARLFVSVCHHIGFEDDLVVRIDRILAGSDPIAEFDDMVNHRVLGAVEYESRPQFYQQAAQRYLRYYRGYVRSGLPTLRFFARYATGAPVKCAKFIAARLVELGIPQQLLDRVRRHRGRVWLLGRDGDTLFAWLRSLFGRKVRYAVGFGRALSDRPGMMYALARALFRAGDLVIDLGYHGRTLLPIRYATGADVLLLVSMTPAVEGIINGDERTLHRLFRDMLVLENLDGPYPPEPIDFEPELRANRLERDEDGVPREVWRDKHLAHQADFVMTFIDTLRDLGIPTDRSIIS